MAGRRLTVHVRDAHGRPHPTSRAARPARLLDQLLDEYQAAGDDYDRFVVLQSCVRAAAVALLKRSPDTAHRLLRAVNPTLLQLAKDLLAELGRVRPGATR